MWGDAACARSASRLAHFSTTMKLSAPIGVCIGPASADIDRPGLYSMQPSSACTAGMLARNADSSRSRWPGCAVMMARTWIMAKLSGHAAIREFDHDAALSFRLQS